MDWRPAMSEVKRHDACPLCHCEIGKLDWEIRERALAKRVEGLQKVLDLERIERMHHAEQDHAEIKRLREALEELLRFVDDYVCEFTIEGIQNRRDSAVVAARKALEASDE